MSDEDDTKNKADQDADFTAKSITDKQESAKKDEAKRHDNEQV